MPNIAGARRPARRPRHRGYIGGLWSRLKTKTGARRHQMALSKALYAHAVEASVRPCSFQLEMAARFGSPLTCSMQKGPRRRPRRMWQSSALADLTCGIAVRELVT